jgi:hypothetical protein
MLNPPVINIPRQPLNENYPSCGYGGGPTTFDLEGNLINGDPKFVALQTRDFRLKGDSPALKLGFKPIPFDKIGLYRDKYR